MNLLRLIQSEPSAKLKELVKESSCRHDGNYPVQFSEEDLKKRLSEKQFQVTQLRGTERCAFFIIF